MKKVLVAFDVDGTLRDNTTSRDYPVAFERVRTGLIWLASMKNTTILLWSGGGELYARQVAESLGVKKYVDKYATKQRVACQNPLSRCWTPDQDHNHFVLPDGLEQPDICVDDIQAFGLGKINLIVREK